MMNAHDVIIETFRLESRKVIAVLLSTLCDVELAEDALQDALVIALDRWGSDGIPHNPGAWIMTTARRKVIDRLRSAGAFARNLPTIEALSALSEADEEQFANSEGQIPDERLKLIFTCCHPALAQESQIALTLQTLGGVTTPEIAQSFLVSESTMAQRLVRAKRKIRDAGIPYEIPSVQEIPERLEAVLTVLYLIFNAGYVAPRGDQLVRHDLCEEAIRLGHVLNALLAEEKGLGADAEALGLLALMILHHARRHARVDSHGELVILEEQDRTRWHYDEIERGVATLDRAILLGRRGPYQIQAAISALHSQADSVEVTDWLQILTLYGALYELQPTPIVALNQSVALAMVRGPQEGLAALAKLDMGELERYHLYYTSRADLLRRVGDFAEARRAYEYALSLTDSLSEQNFIKRRLAQL